MESVSINPESVAERPWSLPNGLRSCGLICSVSALQVRGCSARLVGGNVTAPGGPHRHAHRPQDQDGPFCKFLFPVVFLLPNPIQLR